jgi:hypothetical protein
MDDFGVDRPELHGALLSFEFGPDGRIQQLWASDPNLPEEGEEFQFVLPPMRFGEEYAEDFFPGTIMIGARTEPEDPWILSRNTSAMPFEDDDNPGVVGFEYEFSLLPEIQATGRFYELQGPIPQIVWDVRIVNLGRTSIEIGELGFPFALNNLYEGFDRSDKSGKTVWSERVVIHKSISGAASYLFAQRLNANPPGLLIFPGTDTSWEFYNHVRASLQTPFRWDGIPVVYVYSRAAIEREGWPAWHNEHTSLVLEPGDQRTFQTRFVPAERDKFDSAHQTLAACGTPVMRLLPSGVAPADVGLAVEVAGATPTRFYVNRDAQIETDSDEDGGFCFVKPKEAGPLRLTVEDTLGRRSHAHLMFIDPIEDLIKLRAKWTVENQIEDNPSSALDRGILVTNIKSGARLTDAEQYASRFALEGSLSDAMFLAEKNSLYPQRKEIAALDSYVFDFLRSSVQNPGDESIGSSFTDTASIALGYGSPSLYPLAYSLYHSMYKVARNYGETCEQPQVYLDYAYRTALSMFRNALFEARATAGLPGYSVVYDLIASLYIEKRQEEAGRLASLVNSRVEGLLRKPQPYGPDGPWGTPGYEDVFVAARYALDEDHMERALRAAFAGRSLSPSWWWYGSDKTRLEDGDLTPHPALGDKGEVCHGSTGPLNSMMFFQSLDRDYDQLPEAYMRLAFGGMIGPWALVRKDGAASMGYCPDSASRHSGYNHYTGNIGFALFHYLRSVASYVLPSRNYGVHTFGCHFEAEDEAFIVRPWDGVGRRIVMRQIGAEFEVSFGKIEEVRLDARKRWATVLLENQSDKETRTELRVRGLWGNRFEVLGNVLEGEEGELALAMTLPRESRAKIEIKVIK